MIRAVWFLLLLAIALIAAGAQLDRQSRIDPDLSTAVPHPFRSFAQANVAADMLLGRDRTASLNAAQLLVRRRPVDAAHLRMLAQAQLADGQQQEGERSLQIAGKLGWRDGGTQYGMLQLAMAAGDHTEAARRLAAIWALSTDRDAMAQLAPAVLAHEDARAEFARLVNSNPRWRAKVIREAPATLPAELAQEITTLQ